MRTTAGSDACIAESAFREVRDTVVGMASAATVRVLVRNLESDAGRLPFSTFSLRRIGLDFEAVRKFFPGATRDEWLLEREYPAIPPLPAIAEGWPGPYGGIPFDIEDTLLLLRLFRMGDLAFAGMHIQTPTASDSQYPYRAMSPLVFVSSRPFRFSPDDCAVWERFATSLRGTPQWDSAWFRVVRRCLLYAGGKEFNPNFQDDIDRVIDYMTALEATLVPKSKSLGLCMRERAAKLLALSLQDAAEARELLTKLYDIRSTLVHGSPVKPSQMTFLQDSMQWAKCEELVRRVLVAAIQSVPSDETARVSYLNQLFKPRS